MTSRACAAGGISRLEISSIQGGKSGELLFRTGLRLALFQTRGSGEIWRSGTTSKCRIVVIICSCHHVFLAGWTLSDVLDSELR